MARSHPTLMSKMAAEKRLTKEYHIPMANLADILPYRCSVCGKYGIFCHIRNISNLTEFRDHVLSEEYNLAMNQYRVFFNQREEIGCQTPHESSQPPQKSASNEPIQNFKPFNCSEC